MSFSTKDLNRRAAYRPSPCWAGVPPLAYRRGRNLPSRLLEQTALKEIVRCFRFSSSKATPTQQLDPSARLDRRATRSVKIIAAAAVVLLATGNRFAGAAENSTQTALFMTPPTASADTTHGAGVTVGEIRHVVAKYLTEHPELLRQAAPAPQGIYVGDSEHQQP